MAVLASFRVPIPFFHSGCGGPPTCSRQASSHSPYLRMRCICQTASEAWPPHTPLSTFTAYPLTHQQKCKKYVLGLQGHVRAGSLERFFRIVDCLRYVGYCLVRV